MRYYLFILGSLLMLSCNTPHTRDKGEVTPTFTGQEGEVRLIVLDPGHFHASLLQKSSLPLLNDSVYVYAPDSIGIRQYLAAIDGYNHRETDPTSWVESIYAGSNFMEQMISEKRGNVVLLAGNNRDKTQKISTAVEAGIHVLSDKPMAINSDNFQLLASAYAASKERGVMLYDMMTERYDLLNIIARYLINDEPLFGTLQQGTEEDPAISMESVHHFYKEVSGAPLIRPAWYYDVEQQGEGIADVTTHLIDLIFWSCFPETAIDYKEDIQLISASHWPTSLSLSDFARSTKLDTFPDYLQKYMVRDMLQVYANGIIHYRVNDVHTRLKVLWNFQAPEGGGDTFTSTIKGTNASLSIIQNREQHFVKQLYLQKGEKADKEIFLQNLTGRIQLLQDEYPFISFRETTEGVFLIDIPAEMREDHEAHFKYVAQRFFDFLQEGRMPEWEISNTLAKYYITTKAVEIAKERAE